MQNINCVYNFENNREPLIIGLEKGLGKIFKKDIEKLIETLLDELRDAFESEDFEIVETKRIGIDYSEEAKDFLWRFYIKNNNFISKK